MATPQLSVVVPSVNGWSDLQGCLHALFEQTGDIEMEVLVVDRVGESVRIPLRAQFPDVRLLETSPETTIPALRALAFREARGKIVGVIEDHVIVPPNWAAQMCAAHRDGAAVVGGAVDNAARERLVDWAAFLCEYSHCLAPPSGSATWLTGNNVSYQRPLLERFRQLIDEECWEDRLHAAMRSQNITLLSRPDIKVGHKKHYTIREYLEQRYLYARCYAGMKTRKKPPFQRLIYGLGSLALPPFLLGRILSRVVKARRYQIEFAKSLPLLFLFVISWAIGEAVGHCLGPGNSLSKVR